MTSVRLRFILCIATLLGLCTYSAVVGPEQVDSIRKVLMNAEASAGMEVKLASNVRVVQVLPWELQVEQRRTQISVQVPERAAKEWEAWREQLQVGDQVSLRAVFHPEGYLLLREMHVHKGRSLKIWVSVGALLLLAGILCRERMQTAISYA
jgi:hypothetical protein